jgi:signal transduction histidine kinase
METLLEKIRLLYRASAKVRLTALLFALSFLLLLVLLWRQMHAAYDIVFPVGQETVSRPDLSELPSPDVREVLVLNSYHPGYSWSDNEMTGIVDTFHRQARRIRPLIEYLDCKRFPKMEHFDRLRDLFVQKYRSRDIVLVIAADNPALEFALKYRPELFPRAAIVFCGINGFTPLMVRGYHAVTGVAELLDAGGTLEAALRLHPRTREVVVVHDYTITGMATRRETEEQLKPFAGRVAVRYLDNMPMRDLLEELRKLPSDHLVLALSYSRDKDGNVINHEKISRLLSESAPVPVYGLHEERLGYGIVGGSLLGGRMQGERAAQVAVRVLAGEPVSRIPVDTRSPTRLLFDHRQLARFAVPDSSLPPEAVVVNRPVSFAAEHPDMVLTAAGIILLLLAGIAVLATSIYQRIVAEERQLRLQSQLVQAQKMEAVGLLAGGVAHDFNNMLTAIIGYAHLIRKKAPPEGALPSFADQILSVAERAANLVKALLAFSRKQVMEPQPTDLNSVVRDIEHIARSLVGEDVEFALALEEGPLMVMADGGQLEQVLLNLCTNARDAMPQGGSLTIRTERIAVLPAARSLHSVEREGAYGLIMVTDTGVGMDAETQRQAFEPFFTTKEVGKGTGLGLSIVYGIIKQHGGSVTVSSEPGGGASFRIYLPLIAAAAVNHAPTVREEAPRGTETVLLAEDEAEVRRMVSLVLGDAGYRVVEAADGEDALRRFGEHRDDIRLLLTDVIMPKRNGRDLAEEVRRQNPSVKVLFMSGYTADIIRNKGMLGTDVLLLSKPLVPDRLLARVREVLES